MIFPDFFLFLSSTGTGWHVGGGPQKWPENGIASDHSGSSPPAFYGSQSTHISPYYMRNIIYIIYAMYKERYSAIFLSGMEGGEVL